MWGILVWLWPFVYQTAIIAGLAYLGGRLLTPDVPEADTRQADQARSWNPFTTQSEGLPRPRAYGRNMHEGNIIAKWTDVVGGKEVLYMIVEHGDGPTKGIGAGTVYLNDQASGNFDEVSIQERLGTFDQTVMTGFEKTKLEYPQHDKRLLCNVPFMFTTPNDFFDDIEWTIVFPNGLRHYSKDGDHWTSSTQILVQISEHGLNSWTTVFNDFITDDTVSPKYIRYAVSTYLPGHIVYGKQYDLKITRITGDDGEREIDVSCIRSCREVVNTAFTHPGKAMIGITAVATSRLSGAIKVKVVREDRLINVYDGTSWSIEYSRNRAWVVWDILTQPIISGSDPYTIERYEGIDPARLDLPFFYEWAQWTSEQILDGYGGTEDRCACDIKVMAQTDVFSLAYDIAQAGRVKLYWQGHKLTGWIDKAVTDDPDLVTMDAMMDRTWKNEWAIEKELAGVVEVFYPDANSGYERTPAKFSNANAGSYKNSISIEGTGISTHGTAIHLANYLLERNRLIRNTNSWMTYKDGFRYKLGDVIKLQCKVANWGHGYRAVESTANNTVRLDRDVSGEISPGDLLDIRVFDTNTQTVCMDTYTVESVSGATVTIVETWIVTPLKGCRIAVAAADVLKLRRIIRIDPTVDNYFKITVETYDEDLFDADELDPNNPAANYIWPAPAGQITGPLTRAEITDLIAQLLPPQPDIEIPWPSNLTWTGDDIDTVTWSKTDADDPITFRYRGVTYEIDPDSTTDEFIYWDPDFTTVFRHTNLASTALAAGNWLMCINKDGVAYPANAQQLIHAGVLLAGTIRAESYMELRQTYVYNGDDSLDASYPFEIPFEIVSEMTSLISVKLSFRIMNYRAYSTGATAAAGGGQTSDGGSSWPWGKTGVRNPGDTSSEDPGDTSSEDPGDTNYRDLGSHYHSMPNHDHDVSGRTENADGTGSHSHNTSYNVNISSENPGNTDYRDLNDHMHTMPTHRHTMGTHKHTMGTHDHDLNIPDHTHTISNHTHGVSIDFGLHEENNSPTVHFHVNNGSGFGSASDNYNGDQLDIDITAMISGTGWKGVRFDTNARCRIAAIIKCKIDVTA